MFTLTFARLNLRFRNHLFRTLMNQDIGFFDENHTGEFSVIITWILFTILIFLSLFRWHHFTPVSWHHPSERPHLPEHQRVLEEHHQGCWLSHFHVWDVLEANASQHDGASFYCPSVWVLWQLLQGNLPMNVFLLLLSSSHLFFILRLISYHLDFFTLETNERGANNPCKG